MKALEVKIKPKLKSNYQSRRFSTEDARQASQLMQLFEAELKVIYWTEKALTEAIPKMIERACSQDLVNVLSCHLQETKTHVIRLEEVFNSVQLKAKSQKCEAIECLIREGENMMSSCDIGPLCDAWIISAAQKVEHYEMATYGTLRQLARTMGFTQAQQLLETILLDERAADMKLSVIADTIDFETSM